MSRSDAVQAGSGNISHDIHPRNLERESTMKSFLLIACTAGLLASTALPASAAGPGDHDRSGGSQPLYVRDNDNDWNRQNGQLRPLPYPAYGPTYGNVCGGGGNGGWGGGWNGGNGGWNNGGNGGWGSSYHQPNNGWSNGYYRPRRQLPTQAIAYCVQQQRFSKIKDIDFDDGFYKVYARDPYGRKVKLIVDPYTARIVRVKYR
jgi:Peptidase propeptide and YPEB domain